MATGNNQEEMVRIMKEGMAKAKSELVVSETFTNGDTAVVEGGVAKKEEKAVPFEQKYPNGLGTFDLILKEQRRTNSLLTQLRNHALGIPMSPEEIEESNNV